jgi:hypothetical protein
MSSRQAQLSTHNPFRTPVVTPNPTGASASSSVPPYSSVVPPSVSGPPSYSDPHSDDDEDSPEALPDLTPTIPSARPSQLLTQNTGLSTSSFAPPPFPPRPSSSTAGAPLSSNRPYDPPPSPPADGIPETAPPAYSVTPNVGVGELVVEQGPRRPFQRAPGPLLQLSSQNQQQEQRQQQQLQPPQPQPPRFAPPSGSPGSPPERPHSQLSDFAQDFYNAGPTAAQQAPQQPRYAPPPGPPPPRRPRAASTSSGAGSTAPSASDGRPTTTPTPGHPLLRNGKTLVYPENYLCPKCTFLTPSPTCRSPTLYPLKCEKARIRATRTMTRLTRVVSAGTASASHLRPFSPQARGVPRAAGQRVRARTRMAARSSARCLHSSLHKRRLHGRSQCPARILHYLPQGYRVPRELRLCHMALSPRQARPLSCRAIHASAGGCAGGVVDAA